MNIIVDSDMLIDDCMSILYLMQHEEVNLLGISVTGTGGCYLKEGSHNALSLLKLANLDYKTSVASGKTMPWRYSNVYPHDVRDGASSFNGIDIPTSEASLYAKSVEEFYAQLLDENEEVTILLIGGATNFASYLKSTWCTQAQLNSIKKIVIMAGAVNTPGNLGDLTGAYSFNKVAEWNVFVDVEAMQYIFTHNSLNITLVPLDACNHVILPKSYIQEFENKTSGDLAHYMALMLNTYMNFSTLPFPFFDPLAAMLAVLDDSKEFDALVVTMPMTLNIKQEMMVSGEIDECGQLYEDKSLKNMRVCICANAKVFAQELMRPFLKSG